MFLREPVRHRAVMRPPFANARLEVQSTFVSASMIVLSSRACSRRRAAHHCGWLLAQSASSNSTGKIRDRSNGLSRPQGTLPGATRLPCVCIHIAAIHSLQPGVKVISSSSIEGDHRAFIGGDALGITKELECQLNW